MKPVTFIYFKMFVRKWKLCERGIALHYIHININYYMRSHAQYGWIGMCVKINAAALYAAAASHFISMKSNSFCDLRSLTADILKYWNGKILHKVIISEEIRHRKLTCPHQIQLLSRRRKSWTCEEGSQSLHINITMNVYVLFRWIESQLPQLQSSAWTAQ